MNLKNVKRTNRKESKIQDVPLLKKSSRENDPFFLKEITRLENQLLFYEEEIKRNKYINERMRINNKKLEIVIEQLEQASIYSGISYLTSSPEEEGKYWSKYLRISLGEYSHLLQKAKQLEKVWESNKELVKQTKKTGATEYVLNADPIWLKEMILDNDIYLIKDECLEIEAKARVNQRPWLRKPYVRLIKSDYDSLVSKAAYFDLLQGENFFLRKMIDELILS